MAGKKSSKQANSIKVGIIGFGTVGSGTVEVLQKNRDIIRDRVGWEITVKKIADLDISSDRGISIDPDLLTTEAMEVIADPEIQIVVELIGGIDKAKEYILRAMEKGKHVVTANKALLAEHGKEIYEAAEKNEVSLAFEASVGGGIPVVRSLREGLSANRIHSIMGILNGTSNYILTRMTQKGLPYTKAVEEAIEHGYAEDPPTLDVDGTDAAHKLAILISIVFGVPVTFKDIYREGIDRLTPEDIQFAGELGYCLKLLAIARDLGDAVDARVHPAMVPLNHIMANVNGVYNAIYMEGDFVGPNLYYGLGAGRKPTGSAVVSDLIYLARQIRQGIKQVIPPLAHVHPRRDKVLVQPVQELMTPYYFRFSALDRPGVLSKISGILGENGISISSVIQKGRDLNGSVPLVMLTHEAKESNVINALSQMNGLEILTDKTMMIRVEAS
ncbi:MAG: homoserine dehydrogenase [Deltaproteobacteria bacterium]|nr:homoserine dehydrogenase [Deltaproteobacteria bacterium]MBW1935157.1 homoserine dehydrogenase [Deltaproteobacteria bacterium]MBW1976502.1 homoserine dehydrogenase [Deltaproteobacteria bacterium]MBW2044291.1 homoserine dehydrogenase [Deltaproteobacteria bacterium]MBW2298680.1 homoserine dehydrogenase [Deltaproteobacteria bacterium]